MAHISMTVPGYRCERCGHEWQARQPRNAPVAKGDPLPIPKLCPKCKSPWWETLPIKPKEPVAKGRGSRR